MKKVDVKKELSEEEFRKLISSFEHKFKKVDDFSDFTSECEKMTQKITPAKEAFVLIVKPDTQEFELPTLNKKIPMEIEIESIISECYKSKQPFLINDVTRGFLYNETIDNFLDLNIKDILLIPIVEDSAENNVSAILWMAITKGSWNQFTQLDLDYMAKFAEMIRKMLQKTDFEETDDLEYNWLVDCLQSHEKQNLQMQTERDYFSTIIHDVRTPMTSVIGFLELLKLREEDRGKKEYITTALKSAETMVTLINDALDISKMASGKMDVEKIDFSVFDELSDVAKLFHNTALQKGISLVAYYDPNIPKVICSDHHRIKQIMNNLLSNALKFTPKGGRIDLEIIYDAKIDGITVSVKDTGIGISEEMQKGIFTPYTQEKASTSREYGGTGLGLSISLQLSVLLGGKLELESEHEKGSRFFFTIPCSTSDKSTLAMDKKKIENLSIVAYNPSDDNSMNTVYRYLEEFDLNIEHIDDAKKMHLLSELEFDILVVSRDDTTLHQDEIQEIINNDKQLLIVGDRYLHDDYHWFEGDVRRINAPILPHSLYQSIIELISTDETIGKEKVLAENIEKIAGKSILVIDDNVIILKFMKEVLKSVELQSTLAQGAEDGIDEFKKNRYDMVLIDENMPTMKGSEAIPLIREIEKEKGLDPIAIISITGNADKQTRDKLLSVGADNVLTKPVQIALLKEMIVDYL